MWGGAAVEERRHAGANADSLLMEPRASAGAHGAGRPRGRGPDPSARRGRDVEGEVAM